jgi:hypothetical protein
MQAFHVSPPGANFRPAVPIATSAPAPASASPLSLPGGPR